MQYRFTRKLCSLLTLVLMVLGATARAETYFVSPSGDDNNPGTAALPWRTIIKSALSVTAGDTVLIADGNYAGGIKIGSFFVPNSGTADAPITFRAINPGGAVVWGDQTESTDAFWISHSDYITIDGLMIRNANRVAVRIDVSNHVTVRNCTLLNNRTQGILAGYSDDTVIEYNECAFSIEQHGIYVANSGDRPIIRHNICHDNARCGIQLNGNGKGVNPDLGTRGDGLMEYADVSYNVLYNNGLNDEAAAINMFCVRNSLLSNNLIYNNFTGGISMANENLATETQWGCKNNRILHNTIYFRPNQGRWCISATRGSTNNIVMNNILYGGARGAFNVDGFSSLISDYNLVPTTSTLGVAAFQDTATYFTLPQWQAFSGNDLHSAKVDPAFANNSSEPYDFHLRSWSPAIGAGAPLPEIGTDLDGKPRLEGSTDIGCFIAGEVTVYSISGRVTCNGVGLGAVKVEAGSFYTTTGADGYYTIHGLAAGTYEVEATHPDYAIRSTSALAFTVTVGPASRTGVDFVAAGIIRSITVSPTPVVGGNAATGSVVVGVAAPPGGTLIPITSSSSAVVVPASVIVPEGAVSVSFPITTKNVTSTTPVILTATLGLGSAGTTVNVLPLSVSALTLSATTATGGLPVTGKVQLTGPAPSGGTDVTLSSDSPTASVPATVKVPAGAREVSFAIVTAAVTLDKTVNVTAKLGSSTSTKALKILAPTLQDVWVNPGLVAGGEPTAVVVYLTGPAPAGGIAVKLSMSLNLAITALPATLTVPEGASIASVPVPTNPVAKNTVVTIKGVLGTKSDSWPVTVEAPALVSLTANPMEVKAGSTTKGCVTISAPAPGTGVVVNLACSDSTLVVVPSRVTVATGTTKISFTITTKKPANLGLLPAQVAITATAGNITQVVTLTVQPP